MGWKRCFIDRVWLNFYPRPPLAPMGIVAIPCVHMPVRLSAPDDVAANSLRISAIVLEFGVVMHSIMKQTAI